METLHKRVAGIDVHRMKQVVTVLIEDSKELPRQHYFAGESDKVEASNAA